MARPTKVPPMAEMECVCGFAIGEILVGRGIAPPHTPRAYSPAVSIILPTSSTAFV